MSKHFKTTCCLILLCSLLYNCNTSTKEQKPNQKDSISVENSDLINGKVNASFALLNEKKDSLVSLANENDSIPYSSATHAIIGNTSLAIEFLKVQTENQHSTGRETIQNFSNMGGAFFKIKTPVKQGDFALLVDQQFLDQNQILPFAKIEKEIDQHTKEQLEKHYQKKIIKSQAVYELQDQSLVLLSEFELKNDSALVVLSYLKNNALTNLAFPAKYDEISTWRVDDGGAFDFTALEVLSIFKTDQGIKLLTVFWGAEGYNLNLYEAEKGIFKSKTEAYGYSAAL